MRLRGATRSLAFVSNRTGHQVEEARAVSVLERRNMLDDYLRRILTARVYEAAKETPLHAAAAMSANTGHDIYFKREDMQPVFSFKLRGAYNKIASLSKDQRGRGIIACSAGNHAQGVAFSATQLGIDAQIVMPIGTPSIKVDAVRRFGVEPLLHGESYDDAAAEAVRLAGEEGRTMIHPFDDPAVIAGQGTIGMEILKQFSGLSPETPLDAIFCCVGGGGLVAGVAAYVKRVNPNVRIIGVEAKDAAGMTASLSAGEIVTLPTVGMFADGAAVRRVGDHTFNVCKELVDEMVVVSTDEICAAIKVGFGDTRTVLEPAGALAIAGCAKWLQSDAALGLASGRGALPGRRLSCVAIASGANMDFDRLRFVSERADSSETFVSVGIPERPGAFRELYACIYPRNVTEFAYRYAGKSTESTAHIFCGFQSSGGADAEGVLGDLSTRGYTVTDLVKNEMAKVHARNLVGGHAPPVEGTRERIFRFQFPEKPGALKFFLDCLQGAAGGRGAASPLDVSLFHYRNHGADIGRVLVGLRTTDAEFASGALDDFLDNLDFEYTEETANEVVAQFL